jgi:hypothetical protein
MFAQIASGFGLMVEVDWTTIFKTFYEVVRIKVACRDTSKIPKDRLYEMNKSLFVVSFDVEGAKVVDPSQPGNNDNGGNDDDNKKDNNEDDDDDLLDDDQDVAKDQPIGAKDKMPINKGGKSAISGVRTVNIGLEQLDLWGQEKQLIASMTGGGDKLLTAKGQDLITLHPTIDGMDGVFLVI